MRLTRRSFLAGTTSTVIAAATRAAGAADARKTLRVETRQIEIAGKPAKRYRVAQPSGALGLTLNISFEAPPRRSPARPQGLAGRRKKRAA